VPEVRKVVLEAAVAVTDTQTSASSVFRYRRRKLTPASIVGRALSFCVGSALVCLASQSQAAVLPEDRADAMYHRYDGGGLVVQGPSVLIRKAYKDKVSVWGNYYADDISSASIDVETTASEYSEQRDEYTVGVDYLHGKTFMGLSYRNSTESDYDANSVSFGISQDFFGDLTTLGISYSRGWDTVKRTGDDTFEEDTDRQGYRVDLTQIVTKNLILNLNYEGVNDEGFLNNPYRQVRYVDSSAALGYSWEPEIYPETKRSSATAIRGMYYLPYRASLKGEFRYYTDSWGVDGWNAEVAYIHPLPKGITLEGKYRYYTQTAADFYSDLFPRAQAQNFMARDKELADYVTHTIGAGISYEFDVPFAAYFKKGEASLFVDYLMLDYNDFKDARKTDVQAIDQPLYNFESVIVRAYMSFWF
jgi:hypothetical protein